MRIDERDNPYLHRLGVELRAWDVDRAELALALQPWQLNRQGILQGGVIASLLDAACGYAGLYAAPGAGARHGATLSLSINFVAKVSAGSVRAVGTRTGGGKHIYFAEATLFGAADAVIATAQGSFKYRE
jgi:uncharacterized protein (TIGR00369 family)